MKNKIYSGDYENINTRIHKIVVTSSMSLEIYVVTSGLHSTTQLSSFLRVWNLVNPGFMLDTLP